MITDKIQIILADITKINTDAIVYSSNKSLFKGSGLSKFIYEAAGAKSVEGEALKFAPLDEGAVCFTQGYNLPARYIIHSEELKNKFTGADNIEKQTIKHDYGCCCW